ncbi:MAG: bifunctional UDP-sugar hydrolase/5'-nucleotidase [Paludibacteraceae bacterium]|nr:bifunctional UDP-sugar hydrolase/5'-nucleotidase [Paludibacteraceae bacterium]
MKTSTFTKIVLACLLIVAFACKRKDNIVILFDNDVHCSVEGYAKMAGVKNVCKTQTPYVSVVSCGDFAQGDVIGSLSEGRFIVDIMNQVGYDVVVMGNHEFDYSFRTMEELASQLKATVVSCNLINKKTNQTVFEPYKIVEYGSTKVAYVGVITPETLTSSPKLFDDIDYIFQFDAENNVVTYEFEGDFCADSLYSQVQKYVDAARAAGAHVVVVLAHLGDELIDKSMPTSVALIEQTHGIDVVLDGHAHHIIADTLIANNQNQMVHLSSTGSNFRNIGQLTIAPDNTLSIQLLPIDTLTMVDDSVKALVDTLKNHTLVFGQERVGRTPFPLIANNDKGKRIVRCKETNLANFCTDAFRIMLGTDIAMVNAGGIRDNIAAGDITYNDLLRVFPFNNTVCIATLTGCQLIDVLEFSTRFFPKESGGLMHVSGLRYTLHKNCDPHTFYYDEQGLFMGKVSPNSNIPPPPSFRIRYVQIWDKKQQKYIPIEPEKEYTLAAFDYHLKELGDQGILRYAQLKEDYKGQDVDILARYIAYLGYQIPSNYAVRQKRMHVGVMQLDGDEDTEWYDDMNYYFCSTSYIFCQ